MDLKNEAVLIGGVLIAIINGIVTIAGAGGFDDGLQLADLVPIIGPVLIALKIRQDVWSQDSVDKLATKTEQRKVLEKKK